ncbi:alpha/beta hydrolase family protein [Rothia sp. CCM 9418]|uniref:alpha/beta hydrolase family protein n=1 Tax=Rothia sp. CCM 9418 TaxID=3402661 RepID=UPI003AE9E054
MTDSQKQEVAISDNSLLLISGVARKAARTGALAGAAITATGMLSAAALSTYFARQVVVPPSRPEENLKVFSVGYPVEPRREDEHPTTITLNATPATRAPGEYGLYFDGGTHFAHLGEVLSYQPYEEKVVRRVISVESGDLSKIVRGRLSGVIARTPETAGYRAEEITLNLPVGEAPAWLVHPQASYRDYPQESTPKPSTTWAIMVHGMGVTRAETLRALEATQSLGLTSLHISYRNDRDAPPSDDGRYGLGFTEWQDVDTAIEYALEHGAQDVVLFGWSMGGAISLQTMDRARHRRAIKALVLDGPAIDWLQLIEYQTKYNRLPLRIGELGISMISKPALNIFTGLKRPIELSKMSWTRRPGDIRVPTLILHSLDDTYVPASSSQEIAMKSPLVDFIPFFGATHTREWNVDPQKWTNTVIDWLKIRLG